MEHLRKVSVLLRVLKGDEVHTSLTTEVPGVEPVPVLELVPGFSPGEEVVMLPVLLVVLAVPAHLHPGLVQQRPTIRSQSGLLLGGGEQETVEQQAVAGRHLHLDSVTDSEGLVGLQQQPLAGGLLTTTTTTSLSHSEGHPGLIGPVYSLTTSDCPLDIEL